MISNFLKIKIDKQQREIDLFAETSVATDATTQGCVKHNSTRISSEHDELLYNTLPALSTKREARYFPFNEEEVEGLFMQPHDREQFDMRQDARLAKAVLKRDIIRYFRKRDCLVDIDFIGRIRIWVIDRPIGTFKTYKRYLINLRLNDQYEGWQLEIAEERRAVVSPTPITRLPDLPASGYDVVVGRCVMPRKKLLQQHWEAAPEAIYPVVNPRIEKIVGYTRRAVHTTKKLAQKLAAAQAFANQWIFTADFRQEVGVAFPDGQQFAILPSERVMTVDAEAHDLIFGGQYVGRSPRTDFSERGAYKRPEESYHFFFIGQGEPAKHYGRRMYNIITTGYDYDGIISPTDAKPSGAKWMSKPLDSILHQQVQWEKKLSFFYEPGENPLEVLKAYLRSDRFTQSKGKRYMAIVLSDISRDDPNPSRHILYYRMKELLMQYGIASQVIYRDKIDNKWFRFFLPNIASALVGKMGGMAWGVRSLTEGNDLIVGIGASKQAGMRHPYLGSAFCFDKEGQFRNFNTCRADDTEALMSELKLSIWRFYQDYGKPDRLIIHYYKKKLNKRESALVERMLSRMKIKCPIYVINIVSAVNEDLIAFDEEHPDRMPLSGTYVHLRRDEYLLYNNERYAKGKKADTLYPIKLTITQGGSNTPAAPLAPLVAKQLITQVYQFCRLYWKSVKMQRVPITIAYPEMVAQCVPHFKAEELPEYGRQHLWML